MLKENKQLRVAVRGYESNNTNLRRAIVTQDTVIAATTRRADQNERLYTDANSRAAVAQLKAKKRSWVIVALSAALVGFTYLALTH